MAWELDVRAQNKILQNSIERVINTSIKNNERLLDLGEEAIGQGWCEDADVNLQDWEELKRIVCLLWDRERDTIFREQMAAEQAKKGGA